MGKAQCKPECQTCLLRLERVNYAVASRATEFRSSARVGAIPHPKNLVMALANEAGELIEISSG
jgi:hypothetical protein